eukprot:NODE_3149_length_1037_cov_7.381579_g2793_i1.p3 GENE.NODE_3149_length_1037_cov_7.381579_g2793_i1~~NODE_3149_length_1037_cov_7.381579_g2793_i1.p3  ORF type:complete len:157 (-),score=18.69 NODE_3149_length_1037_cov_7.381579_g2793_i1:27-497(-)
MEQFFAQFAALCERMQSQAAGGGGGSFQVHLPAFDSTTDVHSWILEMEVLFEAKNMQADRRLPWAVTTLTPNIQQTARLHRKDNGEALGSWDDQRVDKQTTLRNTLSGLRLRGSDWRSHVDVFRSMAEQVTDMSQRDLATPGLNWLATLRRTWRRP